MATSATAGRDAKQRRASWLRPPQFDENGAMSLWDHLREVRYRVTISAIAVVVAIIATAFFYEPLVHLIMQPYNEAAAVVQARNPKAYLQLANRGVVGPFTLAVVACVVAGLVIACPVWLYQIWAFVAPGLLKKEKRFALGFLGAAVPLFVIGCAVGYWVWPKGIAVMLMFTPPDMNIMNLLEMSDFLMMEIKIILVFGLSFILPAVLVALNAVGVVRGYQLGRARKGVIFGTCVFAAIATPSTDPFSMLALFVPVVALFLVAELVCRMLDRRRGITEETAKEFAIDVDDGR